jgi:diaminopimelate epimerase
MELNFWKMNGAGNDFVMLDNREGALVLSSEQIARICDRHCGVGADGVLIVEAAEQGADFRMRYYNADGGEAEMCGNGARCFARFSRRFLDEASAVSFETQAGKIIADFVGEEVSLRMSEPHSWQEAQDLELAGTTRTVHFVNTGVPHAVAFVEDLESLNLRGEGPALRYHRVFEPKGTNANFVAVEGPQSLAIRTYERGVEGETLACGTGVCAAALVHAKTSGADSPVSVRVRGGDTLRVSFQRKGNNFTDVILSGPADFVFEGCIQI